MKNSNSLRRQDRIIKLLSKERTMSATQLIDTLGVSGWTIRRDLIQLEDRNLVRRSYGNVELVGGDDVRAYMQTMQRQEDERILLAKTAIGKRAAQLLPPHSQVAMGAGSTTLECARALRERSNELVVMTNGLNLAIELTGLSHIELICTGGTAHGDFFTLNGPVAKRAIQSHHFDIAVTGVGGISVEYGVTVDSILNAEVLEAMIQNAQWVILVADHRKMNRVSFARLAGLDSIDVLVTDTTVPPALGEALVSQGIEIIIAD